MRPIPFDPPLWRTIGLPVLLVLLALSPAVYRLTIARSARPSFTQAVGGGESPIVIRYMTLGSPQQLQVDQWLIDQFNRQSAEQGRLTRVELFMTPTTGYAQKSQLMFATGTAPDVVRVDNYSFPGLVPRGYFYDLTELAADSADFHLNDFNPAAIREDMYHGRLYALSLLFGGYCCYYNVDLFARAGLPDPYDLWKRGDWTWEKFDEFAARLSRVDSAGRPITYGHLVPGGTNGPDTAYWTAWVWRTGGQVLSSDRSRCTLNTPAAISGLQRLHDLIHISHASPVPADAISPFRLEAGNVAMEFGWAGMTPRYRDNIRDFRWDVVPLPQASEPGQRFTPVKGNQLTMSATCPHPKEAWEFMKYMVSENTELVLYGDKLRRHLPTRTAVLHSDEFLIAKRPPFHTDVLQALLDTPRALPLDATFMSWDRIASQFLGPFLTHPAARFTDIAPAMAAAIDNDREEGMQRLARYPLEAKSPRRNSDEH